MVQGVGEVDGEAARDSTAALGASPDHREGATVPRRCYPLGTIECVWPSGGVIMTPAWRRRRWLFGCVDEGRVPMARRGRISTGIIAGCGCPHALVVRGEDIAAAMVRCGYWWRSHGMMTRVQHGELFVTPWSGMMSHTARTTAPVLVSRRDGRACCSCTFSGGVRCVAYVSGGGSLTSLVRARGLRGHQSSGYENSARSVPVSWL